MYISASSIKHLDGRKEPSSTTTTRLSRVALSLMHTTSVPQRQCSATRQQCHAQPCDGIGTFRVFFRQVLLPDTYLPSCVGRYFIHTYAVNLKSVNLQYITLGCLDDGTNEASTKRLIFQVLFFFMISCKILFKNPFNSFS